MAGSRFEGQNSFHKEKSPAVTTDVKFPKFLNCLDKLVSDLRRHHKIPVHTEINQFYYMQKIEELKELKQQLTDAEKRLKFFEQNFEAKYKEIFLRWSKDARWLNRYLLNNKNTSCESIL